jgi:hypothetical protein
MNLENAARILIGIGLVIILGGIILYFLSKIGLSGFRLPGDIYIKKENFTFYFPLATCILLSIIISILLNIFGRR